MVGERHTYIHFKKETHKYTRLFNPVELFTIHDWPTLAYWNSFQIEFHRLYTKQCHTYHELFFRLFFSFYHSFLSFYCIAVDAAADVAIALFWLHMLMDMTVAVWHSVYLFRIMYTKSEHPSQITEVIGIQMMMMMMIAITCFKLSILSNSPIEIDQCRVWMR